MKHSNSKRLVLTLMIALLPASLLQAQSNQAWQHGPPDAETRVAHLTFARIPMLSSQEFSTGNSWG